MNSNRNSTVSGGFISKQSNGTDGASSAEPIKCTGQSGVSSAVPIKHYHPLRCQACFLVIFISQSVQSPLRNINSPFGFHGAVNLSSDSNKRFVYDVGAYNSDDDKADQNVGTLIGKGGEIVRNLQLTLRPVEIIGNLVSIEKAEKLINEVIAQVGVIIGRGDYQEHADKVESTDSGCPFYL
uniref:K Homology domain-containing protein n=1 Tax=Brassica oleracea TaxID=3712 RepID=A0A3P6F4K5_BRAOL|nr:unnamed protein product [Brassica oleracea]